MAVWMQIFGKNNLSEDLNILKEHFLNSTTQFNLDLSFLNGKIYPLIDYYQKPDKTTGRRIHNIPDEFAYSPEKWKWKISQNTENEPYLHFFYSIYDNGRDGINIHFFNDVIMMTGLFEHFNTWFTFASLDAIRMGYTNISEKIFRIFGSKFLYFCSEWCICGEEYNLKFAEFEEHLSLHPEVLKKEITNLQSHEIYKHQIKE